MKTKVTKKAYLLTSVLTILLACAFASAPQSFAAGNSKGGGGGGGSTVFEVRVTGYVTAIDYENQTITIGASYYGSGALKVTDATKISLDNVSCSLDQLDVGDWVEARYDYWTKEALKLSGTSL